MLLRLTVITLLLGVVHRPVLAAEAQPLLDPRTALEVWKFNNGREFPGATGSLTLDAQAAREGRILSQPSMPGKF